MTHIINKELSLLTQKEPNKPERKCQATDFLFEEAIKKDKN